MSGRQPHGDRTRRRKALRAEAHARLRKPYADDARALIQSMRDHNGKVTEPQDRYSELSFRSSLRQLRRTYSQIIKAESFVPRSRS